MADEVVESDSACLDHYNYFFRPIILQGKVAFITGGGSGIGFTITEVLMRGTETAFYSQIKAAKKLENVTGQKCLPVKMDVRKVW
ncbi:peroxisomal 2,4-dienoyl-CoA reductase-like [Stylophora pistillata]|uniref:peroxisomal 2,4-dienoyl-CoA reductase-like n=1 Tax=Stylophora pistillata TaxID=50429 RepID=UPI000C040786|nr:peroxisomal 2,4-dienoyl-CoA reductase-like [Stylophora pistillata]